VGIDKRRWNLRIKNIYDYLIYDGGQYLIASQNDLYGILDISGSWKVKAEFNSILTYNLINLLPRKETNMSIDLNGNWLCEFCIHTLGMIHTIYFNIIMKAALV
jgi:hypothetical protein